MLSPQYHAATQSEPTLLTGATQLPSGKTLYLAFEKITAQNINFWKEYYTTIRSYDHCIRFAIDRKITELNNESNPDLWEHLTSIYHDTMGCFCKVLGWHPEYSGQAETGINLFYAEIAKNLDAYIQGTDTAEAIAKLEKMKESIDGGGPVDDLIREEENQEISYMVYGSTQPITAADLEIHRKLASQNYVIYSKLFGNIIITMPYRTTRNTPTVTHYGLVKNTDYRLDPNNSYAGVALPLKGFSATCTEQIFPGEKKFLTTSPLVSLVNILERTIGAEKIHVTSDAPKYKKYGKKILSDDWHSIHDPESGKTQCYSGVLNHAGISCAFPPIAVSLDELRKLYRPTATSALQSQANATIEPITTHTLQPRASTAAVAATINSLQSRANTAAVAATINSLQSQASVTVKSGASSPDGSSGGEATASGNFAQARPGLFNQQGPRSNTTAKQTTTTTTSSRASAAVGLNTKARAKPKASAERKATRTAAPQRQKSKAHEFFQAVSRVTKR